MREIASIGVQTVIVSWWGPGSAEAARLPLVARAARAAGLRVALHVEPFAGRTPASLVPQLRASRQRRASPTRTSTTRPRAPTASGRQPTSSWPDCGSSPTRACPGRREAGGFAGLYTYDVRIYDGTSFPRMCASARMHNLLCAPSVGPGFDAERATGDTRVQGRAERQDLRPHVARARSAPRPTSSRSRATTSGTRGRRSSRPRQSGRRTRRTTAPTASRAAPPSARTSSARRRGCARYREKSAAGGPRPRSLVERGREPAAIRADERIVGVEALEERHRNLAQPLALARPRQRELRRR